MLEIRCSESEAVLRMRGMPSFCITAQRTPGEGWSKLMEDLTDLRKVLPEASGTAGFFWNGLSFDCFPIACSQAWVPNVVYTRHPRFWVNHGGTMVGPFDSSDAAYAWIINDGENGGIGGSVVDDSYTTSEDQGHYEQKATGQHWVVDVAGHWE